MRRSTKTRLSTLLFLIATAAQASYVEVKPLAIKVTADEQLEDDYGAATTYNAYTAEIKGFPFNVPRWLRMASGGILVPPDNKEAIVSAVRALCAQAEKGEALSRAARKKVEAFDWEIVKH
ncbi:MAG: hypothetical protein AAF604_15625, partial [Acidobacteriota bacterium]